MLFGRNRNVKVESVSLPEGLEDLRDDATVTDQEPGADKQAAEHGPFDISQQDVAQGYLNLGSLHIPLVKDLQVRLDQEESTGRIIAATLTLNGSTLQVQAFAAPRQGGLWQQIRPEIMDSVAKNQGSEVGERAGRFGTEVLARIPAQLPDGRAGWRVARFLGVDGPRWFLRAVVGGPAAYQEDATGPLDEIFSRIVVDRGQTPLPPRDLLPLQTPQGLQPSRRRPGASQPSAPGAQDGAPTEADAAEARQDRRPPERGPEIPEVR